MSSALPRSSGSERKGFQSFSVCVCDGLMIYVVVGCQSLVVFWGPAAVARRRPINATICYPRRSHRHAYIQVNTRTYEERTAYSPTLSCPAVMQYSPLAAVVAAAAAVVWCVRACECVCAVRLLTLGACDRTAIESTPLLRKPTPCQTLTHGVTPSPSTYTHIHRPTYR